MRGACVDGSMSHTLTLGKMTNTLGCCPVCGHEVAVRQSFNGQRLLESYGCSRCGPTEYVVAVA